MKRKLRSNFAIGSSFWAVRRAQWRALGLTDADMEKPKIAVVNTSSELAICFSHLDGIAAQVKEAIRAAGGLPFEVRTTAPSDFIHSAGRAGTYILPARDLITNDIEVAVEGAQLDGMICLASCDKTTPGQIMAAARLNLPALMLICGYQPSGQYQGEHVDIEDVFLAAGHHLVGKVSLERLTGMSENAIRGPGVCSGMGTANSMHIVCEALGMALPGSAPVLANSPRMFDFVRRSGERIVAMVEEDLRPRSILTPEAFANAAKTILSLSGSINVIKHLQAIAVEAKCDIDVYALFERYAEVTPVLCAVRPNGDTTIEELEAAGGAQAVMKRLEPLLETSAVTVSGYSVADNLREVVVTDDTIRPLDRPLSTKAPIVIVRGNLAPEGGIVKLGLRYQRKLQVSGRARVYQAPDEAIAAVKAGAVKAGDVVVLRGLGVQGGPGMGMASRVVFAIEGAGLGEEVAVITDGQLSGLVNRGLVVGEVKPEAAVNGPIAAIREGDTIAIDIVARTVDLKISQQELEARLGALAAGSKRAPDGWLSVYQRTVQALSRGATLIAAPRQGPPDQ
ncbi:dihydroxy-acid dehydratase [mine drainage metagenome]|uniref:Dihydroxy-acid dehydratase n=1 Tax=mine drainage metagenome TaxID=410659 RepID=A0A1J5RRP4_9ZZZZ